MPLEWLRFYLIYMYLKVKNYYYKEHISILQENLVNAMSQFDMAFFNNLIKIFLYIFTNNSDQIILKTELLFLFFPYKT